MLIWITLFFKSKEKKKGSKATHKKWTGRNLTGHVRQLRLWPRRRRRRIHLLKLFRKTFLYKSVSSNFGFAKFFCSNFQTITLRWNEFSIGRVVVGNFAIIVDVLPMCQYIYPMLLIRSDKLALIPIRVPYCANTFTHCCRFVKCAYVNWQWGYCVCSYLEPWRLRDRIPKRPWNICMKGSLPLKFACFCQGIIRQQMCVEAGSLTSARLKYFEKNKMFSISICFVTNGLFSFQTSNLALSDC